MTCRLYLISPPSISLETFPHLLAEAFSGGEVACFQLRLKGVSDAEIIAAAKALLPVCEVAGVPFLLNDRPDLVVKTGANGVHVGEEDGALKEGDIAAIRRQIGEGKVLGVSCYGSTDRAMMAGEAGADYVSFGAFFPTTTKEAKASPSPDILRGWSELTVVPSVAIGGVNVDNCALLAKAGADFVAVISGVWSAPQGPKAAVALFTKALEEAA